MAEPMCVNVKFILLRADLALDAFSLKYVLCERPFGTYKDNEGYEYER